MRVLLVTADPAVLTFGREVFAVEAGGIGEAEDGDEALGLARCGDHDLILIDDDLPDMGPLALVRRLRREGVVAGVVLLGDRIGAADRARALDLGADDCVGRSIAPGELLARGRAVARRAGGHASSLLTVGRLSLDIAARTVAFAGRPLRITGKEFALLELLALRRGRVVGRETIMDHLYGGPDEPVAKVIDIHVCRIRRKLAAVSPGACPLRTVWGQGFILADAEQTVRRDRLAA